MPKSYFILRSQANNAVLQLKDLEKGSELQTAPEYTRTPNQHFCFNDDASISCEAKMEYVLDLDSSGKILLWKPNGQSNQKWKYDREQRTLSTTDKNALQQCMTLQQANQNGASPVVGSLADQSMSQKFLMQPAERPFYIKSRLSKLILECPDDNVHSNCEVVYWNQQGEPAQQWVYDNGYIVHVKSGKVMQMNNDKSVSIQDKTGGINQRWNWDGEYVINAGNGQVLEVPEGNASQGVKAVVAMKTGEKKQQFWWKYVNSSK